MTKVLMAVDETTGSKSVLSVNKTMVRVPSEEILKVAREEKVDLIIMGISSKTGFLRFVAGCTAREVERSAAVPVLVAKTAGCEKSNDHGWRGAYAA